MKTNDSIKVLALFVIGLIIGAGFSFLALTVFKQEAIESCSIKLEQQIKTLNSCKYALSSTAEAYNAVTKSWNYCFDNWDICKKSNELQKFELVTSEMLGVIEGIN